MAFTDILSVGLATLIIVVVAHFVVFWVVRTLYPPVAAAPAPAPTPAPAPAPAPEVFTQPTLVEQQNVSIPTYEAPVSVEAPRQEGSATVALDDIRGPPA